MKLDGLDHPKTFDLCARLDASLPLVVGHLELLWAFVATKTPQGNIGRWPNGAIARGAHWQGDPDTFVNALTDAGFIDIDINHRLMVHDWYEHCPSWVRSKLNREGGLGFITPKKTNLDASADASPYGSGDDNDASADGSADYSADSPRAVPHAMPCHAMPCQSTSSDEEESPAEPDDVLAAPDAKPKTEANGQTPACPAREIVDEYHRLLPELPVVAKLTAARRRALQARWRERKAHQDMDFWRWYFTEPIRGQPFLLGDNPRGWRADFEWLVKEANFYKTVEGKYENAGA